MEHGSASSKSWVEVEKVSGRSALAVRFLLMADSRSRLAVVPGAAPAHAHGPATDGTHNNTTRRERDVV